MRTVNSQHIVPTEGSEIIEVDLNRIIVDTRVQRIEGMDAKRVAKLAANFDIDATGILIISARSNGDLVVLDGMHRSAAAIEAGVAHLTAKVFYGLTTAQEARLFTLYNTSKQISSVSRFLAEVAAGSPDAVEMSDIIQRHGWTVRSSSGTGTLVAITAVRSVYERGAGACTPGAYPELLDQTLAVLTESWGHDESAVHATLISGVGLLFARLGGGVDVPKLIREMQQTMPLRLVGQARTLHTLQKGTQAAALAKILVGLHNSRKRSGALPDWTWAR